MAAPTPVRKYPYEDVDGFIKISTSQLDVFRDEPEWKNATMAEWAKEYLRRAAEECGEDVQLDSTKPVQLRVEMSGCSPEKAQAVFEKMQGMGLDVQLFQKPLTVVQDIREMCDQICLLAEKLKPIDGIYRNWADTTHGKVMDRLTEIYCSMQDALSEDEEEEEEDEVADEDTTKE